MARRGEGRREDLDGEDLGEALLEELDELACEALGDDEAQVELFAVGDEEHYGYEVTVGSDPVRAESRFTSICDAIEAFREWCEECEVEEPGTETPDAGD